MFLLTFPSCRHRVEFLAHPPLATKIVSAHLHFCLFMLIWTKWQMQKKKKNPMKDLAGLSGKSVNTRSPRVTNCS